MVQDLLAAVLIMVGGIALVFSVLNAVFALSRWHSKKKQAKYDQIASMIKDTGRAEAFNEIAKFADEYLDDSDFGMRIRQLYYARCQCCECKGKGKKWTNSAYKCSECWGTGKRLD